MDVTQSSTPPVPHSCEFCSRLVLATGDEHWWEKQLEPVSEDREGEKALSKRVRDWICEQLEIGSRKWAGDAGTDLAAHAKYDTSKAADGFDVSDRPGQEFPRLEVLRSLSGIYILDCTLSEARLNSSKECLFCSYFLKDWQHHEEESTSPDGFIVATRNRSGLDEKCELRPGILERGTLGLEFTKDDPSRHHFFFKFKPKSHRGFLKLFAAADNCAALEVPNRYINIHPGSESSFAIAKTWLRNCLETHPNCSLPRLNFVPTRLIEIFYTQGRLQLRLRETKDQAVPYVALSYCWGGDQLVQTTSNTLQRYLAGISFEELPPTIRDAVTVTEKLQVMNLWIDAFCIIQDDLEDKAREIAQMPLVYGQSVFTIAASRASGVEAGFLQDRAAIECQTPRPALIQYQCSTGQIGSVLVFLGYSTDYEMIEPLDFRAWALQERFLSRRVLDYGETQTRWVCQHSDVRQEAGSTGLSFTDGYKEEAVINEVRFDWVFPKAKALLSNKSLDSIDQRNIRKALDLWRLVVSAYTARTLTFGSDRLPAISGIAAQFGKVIGSEYKAGTWDPETMPTELLWANYSGNLQPRPVKYQGPSWSWAAINSPISCIDDDTEAAMWLDDCFQVLDCRVNPQSMRKAQSPLFGAVESGYLVLKGRLRPAELTRLPDNDRGQVIKRSKSEYSTAKVYLDALEEEFSNSVTNSIPVFLLKMTAPDNFESRIPVHYGFIFRERLDSNFSRLGVFNINVEASRLYEDHGIKYREYRALFYEGH